MYAERGVACNIRAWSMDEQKGDSNWLEERGRKGSVPKKSSGLASDSVVCAKCESTSSLMWHRREEGGVVCHLCQASETSSEASMASSQGKSSTSSTTGSSVRKTRLRERLGGGGGGGGGGKGGTKGGKVGGKNTVGQAGSKSSVKAGRRQLIRGKPIQSVREQPTVVTCDSVVHNGTTYEVGDVVSVLDYGGGVYYALLRGFLQDQCAQKYAVLTWLLPNYSNPTAFDPLRFFIGPEDDQPWPMEHLVFVSHSPWSRHFQSTFHHNISKAELWSSKSLPVQ